MLISQLKNKSPYTVNDFMKPLFRKLAISDIFVRIGRIEHRRRLAFVFVKITIKEDFESLLTLSRSRPLKWFRTVELLSIEVKYQFFFIPQDVAFLHSHYNLQVRKVL